MAEIELEINDDDLDVIVEIATKPLEDSAKKVNEILNGLRKTTDETASVITKAFEGLWSGLGGILTDIGALLLDAFTIDSQEDLLAATERFGEDFANELYDVQTNLDGLEMAIVDAAAPIVQVLMPIFDGAITMLTDFANQLGQVVNAIFGAKTGADAVAQGTQFTDTQAGMDKPTMPTHLQETANQISSLMAPLQQINLTPLLESFNMLGSAAADVGLMIQDTLGWLWFNVLAPLGEWCIEEAAPAAIDTLTSAFDMLSVVLAPVLDGVESLMTYLEPLIAFIEETVVLVLSKVQEIFEKVGQTFSEKGEKIQGIFSGVGEVISAVWTIIEPIFKVLRELVGCTFDYIGDLVSVRISGIIDVLHGIVEFIAGVFSGNWERAWEGIKEVFFGLVNGIIGQVNVLISGVVNGINVIIRALNKLKIKIPDWVPGFGGQTFGFNIKELTAPQIPYLAKGAVLPANRPFLAVVGDQRHGTNVEAPLATIQEAVGLVMNDHISAMMAGFRALLEEQQATRRTIEGIEIGDRVIGEAAQRYQRKMAVTYGTF